MEPDYTFDRDDLSEDHEEMILYDGLDDALVGYTSTDKGTVAVYDYSLMVESFVKVNDWDRHEAIEWIEFNIIGALVL